MGRLFHGFLNSVHIDPTKIRPEFFLVRGVIGHEGRTWGQGGRRVIQNTDILYCPLGVIPKLIKVRIKGRSLIRVIGPSILPITRWVGIVQDRRIPFDTIYIKTQVFRLLRYYSPAPRNIARSDWATQNITHNMTSSIT